MLVFGFSVSTFATEYIQRCSLLRYIIHTITIYVDLAGMRLQRADFLFIHRSFSLRSKLQYSSCSMLPILNESTLCILWDVQLELRACVPAPGPQVHNGSAPWGGESH